MKLSVIIPCFNGAKTIAVQLEALANQRWSEPWEVIVSDNGSTDGSMAIVEQYRDRLPNLCIVDASDRRGGAHARNVGAMAAMGNALAFTDQDDEVAPGWLSAMGEALSKYDFVACREDHEKLNSTWAQRVFPNYTQHSGFQKVPYPPYLPFADGTTLGVKKSLHEAVGGFDESLRYGDDIDYCFKIQLRGVDAHFVPDAVLHYRCRDTLGGFFRQQYLWAQDEVLLYNKYRPPGTKILRNWIHYLRCWKELLFGLRYVRKKEDYALWLQTLAYQMGYFLGSIRFWAPPPPRSIYEWMERVRIAIREITRLIPRGNNFILVDQDEWRGDVVAKGYHAIPFLERDEQYWGTPPDDETAIRELERLRKSGASFMVFAWPAFWWLDFYSELNRYLRSRFQCVMENDRLVIFDLRHEADLANQ